MPITLTSVAGRNLKGDLGCYSYSCVFPSEEVIDPNDPNVAAVETGRAENSNFRDTPAITGSENR
jgi:hypothetical protein